MQQLQFFQTILLVLQLIVCVSMVIVILLQRSEGGALGMGSGGGLMTARGAGNFLTRTTAVLACCFFALSVGLVVLGNYENSYTAVGKASTTLKRNPLATAPAATAPTPAQAPGAAAANNAAGSLGDLENGAPIQLKPSTGAIPAPAQPPAKK